MALDDLHLKIVIVSELFHTDRVDNLTILPYMLHRLSVNHNMDLLLVIPGVEVLCEPFAAHSALKLQLFISYYILQSATDL